MSEADIGRLLPVSLHQGIADLLPTRLEFYEAWVDPAGLRLGRFGLGPLAAVLGFLRQEGEAYRFITARAGEYAAEWTFADLRAFTRALILAAPPALRVRLVMHVAQSLIHSTYRSSGARVSWRKGRGAVEVRRSVFCEVRDRVDHPLCEFYVSAIRRLMWLFGVDAEVGAEQCRAAGAGQCLMVVRVRPAGGTVSG